MASFWITLVVISTLIHSLKSSPNEVLVGGIFEDDQYTQELAFKTVIQRVNEIQNDVKVVGRIEKIPRGNSFQASQKACSLLSMGVVTIFGPQSWVTASHVQSICEAMKVPYIAINWNLRGGPTSVNIQLHLPSLIEAQQDLVRHWGWTSFAILYEYSGDLKELTHFFGYSRHSPRQVSLWQLPVHRYNFREVLKQIKAQGYTNIIIDCQIHKVETILKHAQQVGMMTDEYHYFINNMDLDFSNLTDFQFSGTTIMSFRSVDLTEMNALQRQFDLSNVMFDHQSALLMDSVYLFVRGLVGSGSDYTPTNLSCSTEFVWAKGAQVVNAMKMSSFQGYTGEITLDNEGYRSHFNLDIIQLHPTGLEKVGTWSKTSWDPRSNTLKIMAKSLDDDMPGALEFRTLRVVTVLTPPYVQKSPMGDQYEGFCIDLIDELSKHLGFKYNISLAKDGKYGRKDQNTGEWNGVFRDLLDKNADLAIGDLTITTGRAEIVHFSSPFLHVGITAVFQERSTQPQDGVRFWTPFSSHLWWYIAGAYVLTCITLFVLARFLQWGNPYPCIKNPEFHYNDLGIMNSLWFILGSLMLQGSNLVPKSIATRIVAVAWWFFAIFMVAIYTANMMSTATIRDLKKPIKDEWELITRSGMRYGCVDGGSTKAFFEMSNIDLYKQVFADMAGSEPSGFVKSTSEGLDRVKQGNFAFFVESTTADYLIERDCELQRIETTLDNKGYGLMFPKDSPFQEEFSSSILKLQDEQVIKRLQKKWWRHKRSLGHCNVNDERFLQWDATNFLGLFIILIVGLLLASLVATGEFVWDIWQIRSPERGTIGHELWQRLKFTVGIEPLVRVRKPISKLAIVTEEEEEELPSIS